MRMMIALTASICFVAAAAAEEVRPQLLSYEALPSAQITLNLEEATYLQRAEVTAQALSDIAPQIIEAAGFDPEMVETEMTPGGYLLKTNVSLQARAPMSDQDATRLSASLGYVFRQYSVLVSELDEAGGGTAYVTVSFPEGALTPDLAQAFFEHAASIHEGLGGGYTAFGDDMIFLNVRGGDGAPFSGLDDLRFAAFLGQAAGGFEDAEATIGGAGEAEARFVGNDWEASPNGEAYATLLDDEALVAALDDLRAEHTALVEAYADQFGWR